jgi:archaellum component FlaF (FlaF/FlaG flagellin family)
MQVKIFQDEDYEDVEEATNKWLKQNPNIKVLSTDHSTVVKSGYVHVTVVITYKGKLGN